MVWHFSIISLQYIIGGCISIIITLYILHKTPKTLETLSFLFYGLFITVWAFFIFLHRTAPTAGLSRLFFRIALFFPQLFPAMLLVTILCVINPKKRYLLYTIPAVTIGTFELMVPIEISWSRWGWAYEFGSHFLDIYVSSTTGYSIVIFYILGCLIKKYRLSAIQKKYKIILVGYLLYATIPPVTNYMISRNPNFPPSTGIVTAIFFLFVAYAINLPTDRIIPSRSMNEIANSYLQFLNAFQAKTPSKELGGSSFRFQEYIEAMGLKDVVVPDSGKLTFSVDKLSDQDISEIPDDILRVIKEHSWAIETVNGFTRVFIKTYETMRLESTERANEWLEQMFQRHGSFLAKQGVLAAMPKGVKLPHILRELQPGRTYLFKEERPVQAYKKLKEVLNYGFMSLCISKLPPEKIRERYGVEKAIIFWLTFNKAEGRINPKDLAKLNKTISEFIKRPEASIVLLDCFDQIKFASGFQKSLTMLKDFRNLCNDNNCIILISINPEMFDKQQLAAIEKQLDKVIIE